MPPAMHNSTIDKAMGLISSLFDVALSRDVPFCQPQYVQYIHHRLAFVLLCVPVLFVDNARCQFAIERCSFLVAVLAIMLIAHIFCSDWIDFREASCIFSQARCATLANHSQHKKARAG